MFDLTNFLTSLPVIGIASTIDRPGYDARYRKQHGRQQWHLCKTAFCIALERAVKFARRDGRKLRVYPEKCSKGDDKRLDTYYRDLKATGLPFETATSAAYAPLSSEEFATTLYELKFKEKTSPMVQIADLYLWPIAMARYEPRNRAYMALQKAGKLIECHVTKEQLGMCGSKYSCFELVDRHLRGF
jgi:hypothetical protein